LKELKERKLALRDKERELGGNHEDTLLALEKLAWTYHEVGQWRQAKVLKVAVLQKRRAILGDNHPDTLGTMSSLAATYYRLGQYEKAAELEMSVLDE
jgi:tetratricopeptide (TPR) repeat protein